MPIVLDPPKTIKIDPPLFNPDNVTLELSPEGLARVKDLGITPAKLSFGTWQKVTEVNVTTNVTQINLDGLNLDNDKAYMLIILHINGDSANVTRTAVRFNGDTGTNYRMQQFSITGTTLAAGTGTANNCFDNVVWSVDAGVGNAGMAFCMLTGKSNTKKMFWSFGGDYNNNYLQLGEWTNTTSNLTTINLIAPTGNYGVGTRILLFKLSS
jgi:hypothetical protein